MKVNTLCPSSGWVCKNKCKSHCLTSFAGTPVEVVLRSEVDRVIEDLAEANRKLSAWQEKAGADRALRVSELAMKYAGEMFPRMSAWMLASAEDQLAIMENTKRAARWLAEEMVPPVPNEQSATVADGGHNPGNPTPEHGRDANPEPAGQADRLQHPGG